MSTLVERIKDLVGRDQIEQALQELKDWTAEHDNDLHNTVILLSGRLNNLRSSERKGIITREEGARTGNQIRYNLLSVLDDLPDVQMEIPVDEAIAGEQKDTLDKPVARKLFISYAREDQAYVKNLERHLSSLIRSNHIASWTDSQILPGQEWNKEIEERLRSADIILYMVSSDFIDSDFINKHERVWAEETKANKGALIVPVLLRSCYWEGEDFAKYGAVPKHPDSGELKPISRWQDKDYAYVTIVKELGRIIDAGAKK